MQRRPLLEEQVLHEAEESDLVFQLAPGSPDGIGVPEFELIFPLVPRFSAELVLQRHEQGKIRQPAAVFGAEDFVIRPGGEAGECRAQHLQAVVVQQAEVHLVLGDIPPDALQILLREQAIPHQGGQVDEVVVAREGGAGLIGGVAKAGGRQGQDLPGALAGFFQEIHKFVCLLSHGTNTIFTGQAGNVHQNTAGSHDRLPQLFSK